jgi:hypothetical protein
MPSERIKIVHVQSVLPQEDVQALQNKAGSVCIKDAISKAVYYYLDNAPDEPVKEENDKRKGGKRESVQ